MKRFVFRLAPVLAVRRIQEEQARAALLAAQRQVDAAADVLRARVGHYDSLARPAGVQAPADFVAAVDRLDRAAAALFTARATVRARAADAEAARGAWRAAQARVDALERLEQRARETHAVEVRRAEDRLVDDLVTARHATEER